MATATITLKKGTTAEWTESKRVLDDGELGLETTTSGHRIIRIGNGSTEFMSLPVAFDIEEVREIKTGMDEDAKTYYDDMVKKGTELLAEMKALATTVELEDDATQIKYRMGISNGTLYFEEITKEASEYWQQVTEYSWRKNPRRRRFFPTQRKLSRTQKQNRKDTE